MAAWKPMAATSCACFSKMLVICFCVFERIVSLTRKTKIPNANIVQGPGETQLYLEMGGFNTCLLTSVPWEKCAQYQMVLTQCFLEAAALLLSLNSKCAI